LSLISDLLVRRSAALLRLGKRSTTNSVKYEDNRGPSWLTNRIQISPRCRLRSNSSGPTSPKLPGQCATLRSNRAQAQTEKVWTEVKRQADSVSREIEERPIAAVLTAFGAGLFLGRLLTALRG